MPKSRKKSQQQLREFRRAVEAYGKLRSHVIIEAINWYEAHQYATEPVPPLDRELAKATRRLVEVDQKAVSIRDGDTPSGRASAKRR